MGASNILAMISVYIFRETFYFVLVLLVKFRQTFATYSLHQGVAENSFIVTIHLLLTLLDALLIFCSGNVDVQSFGNSQ